ncbi:hypothetical protein BC792_12343 [Sphingobacterium allocomposti]|uniref:Uncharacterized protein n=1 Tax=Sphingobacterium allocomposti TaxID=415956 RepID=A0A5S5D5L4_9SPHI|nr:hypothetical protein BC792_12343 [Sphingobacterium composti Yoo et al. 2007 non Ten et al. 2007]
MFIPFFKQIKILIYSSITKKFLTAEEELAKTLYIQRDFFAFKKYVTYVVPLSNKSFLNL